MDVPNIFSKPAKAQNIRYIASVEKTKKKVMEEIHEEVKDENFNNKPLVCVMDGALYLWTLFKDVFKDIENKVLVLDIIHVLQYIWIIAQYHSAQILLINLQTVDITEFKKNRF